MKTTLYTLLVCITFLTINLNVYSQSPEWQWSKRAGGSELDIGRSIKTDATGNVFVAGSYNSSSITFGGITLSSSASTSLFLVKYNPLGEVVWAKTSEGSGTVDVNSMAVDSEGNILLAGKLSSLSLILGSVTLTSQGSDDAYLVKFDPDGNVLWAKSAGSSTVERILGIDCDVDGNIYATGNFNGATMTFGNITITNSNTGGLDAFLVKYDADGNEIWAHDIGGNGADWGRVVSVDSNGDILISGEHASNSLAVGSLSLTNEEGTDVFVAKFNSSGTAIWAKSGNSENSTCQALTVDSNNNVYISGSFYGNTIVFDNITLNNSGQLLYSDFFIVKMNSDGNFEWARSSSGDEQEEGRTIAIDASGNICVAGFFISPSTTFDNTTFQNYGLEDSFVTKYNPAGEMVWAIAIGAAYIDYIHAMTSDNFGNLYVTGFFSSGALAFGEHEIYTSNSGWDFFIAKLGESTNGINLISNHSFQLYPNPFSENCTINLSKPLTNGTLILENTLGQRVLETRNLSGSKITLQRNDIKNGNYFIHLLEDHEIVAQGKLIVID